jgi:hypothetical protein
MAFDLEKLFVDVFAPLNGDIDIVYARGNPIVCTELDFVLPDGTRKTAIVDGELCVWFFKSLARG